MKNLQVSWVSWALAGVKVLTRASLSLLVVVSAGVSWVSWVLYYILYIYMYMYKTYYVYYVFIIYKFAFYPGHPGQNAYTSIPICFTEEFLPRPPFRENFLLCQCL